MRRIGYQNAVLTAIAVLLALGLIEQRSGARLTEPAAAHAQQPDPDQGGMTNKLEQNKQMIAELRLLNGKLERLEAKIAAGLSVKVTSMPPVQVNETNARKPKEKEEAPAPKPAPAK